MARLGLVGVRALVGLGISSLSTSPIEGWVRGSPRPGGVRWSHLTPPVEERYRDHPEVLLPSSMYFQRYVFYFQFYMVLYTSIFHVCLCFPGKSQTVQEVFCATLQRNSSFCPFGFGFIGYHPVTGQGEKKVVKKDRR